MAPCPVFQPLPRTDHHTRAVQASSHLAGALSEGGGGNAKGGGGGGKVSYAYTFVLFLMKTTCWDIIPQIANA